MSKDAKTHNDPCHWSVSAGFQRDMPRRSRPEGPGTDHRNPRETTSCAAGAIWGPYLVDDDRVLRWSERTLTVLCGLADEAASGVRMIHGLEASRLEDAATRLGR